MQKVNKVAILIDGGFFKQRFKKNNNRDANKDDIENLIMEVMKKLEEKSGTTSVDILFRSYYYDCLPFSKQIKDVEGLYVDYSTTSVFEQQTKLIDSLKDIEQFALRLGEVSFTGWKINPRLKKSKPRPDFRQKGVDIKIGLDMAWMAGKGSVDKMILIGGDSDFISPIKFVRREGVLVYLYPMGNNITRSLKEHCDFILS